MHINIGDLVERFMSSRDDKLGIVINKNSQLSNSIHTAHIVNCYQPTFYVHFSNEGLTGPYLECDLRLKQSR
jgi:hypothetical protein